MAEVILVLNFFFISYGLQFLKESLLSSIYLQIFFLIILITMVLTIFFLLFQAFAIILLAMNLLVILSRQNSICRHACFKPYCHSYTIISYQNSGSFSMEITPESFKKELRVETLGLLDDLVMETNKGLGLPSFG